MKRKIKITKFARGGSYGDMTPPSDYMAFPHTNTESSMGTDVNRTLKPVNREDANLEAEKGETVITNLQGDNLPEFYTVGGKPHYEGGSPLNLPDNSFIFSKDRKLKIKDPEILKMFGKTGDKGYTPAELSKSYDLNKYRKVLASPESDHKQRETAEQMMQNYNRKLGALALVQESMKGFDSGIPAISIPYLESMGFNPEEFLNPAGIEEQTTAEFKKGGSVDRKRKIKLKLYNPGGEPGGGLGDEGSNPVKKQKIPDNAKKWDPADPDYDESKFKEGDYVLRDDGYWYRISGRRKQKPGSLVEDPKLGRYQEDFSLLYETFQDPDVRKMFVEEYRKELATLKPSRKMTQKHISDAMALSDDEIINTFLYKNKTNLALDNYLNDKYGQSLAEYDKDGKWDKVHGTANKYMKELGYKEFDDVQTIAFQTGYVAFAKLSQSPDAPPVMKKFGVMQVGKADEPGGGTNIPTISDVDMWDGNTTSGQVVMPLETEWDFEIAPDEDEEEVEADPKVQHLGDPAMRPPAKWWTQDLVNMAGAASDYLGLKKHMPWQATPQFTAADPTFTDFRGSAARIGSMSNALAEQAATFGDPQSYGAMAANIQKGMVDPILQTQEHEARTNVGITNEFEMYNTGAKNQYDMTKANLDTMLYDKYMAVNQNFDNAKRALKHNMLQAFNTGWTNKGQTQALNELYDNYWVDPKTGYLQFYPGRRDIKPSDDNMLSFEDEVTNIKGRNPEMSWQHAINIAKANRGHYSDYPTGLNAGQFAYPDQ